MSKRVHKYLPYNIDIEKLRQYFEDLDFKIDVSKYVQRVEQYNTRLRECYLKNKDKILSILRARYWADVEKSREKGRQNYQRNREKALQRAKEYREKNHDKILAKQRVYRQANKKLICERQKAFRHTLIGKEKLAQYNKKALLKKKEQAKQCKEEPHTSANNAEQSLQTN